MAYSPPPLDKRVRLRNPSDKPVATTNEYGGLISQPTWGLDVWAHRSDRSSRTLIEETATIEEQSTVWTIRERANVAADVEIVYKGQVFEAIGQPRIRGGAGQGRATRYFEIRTRQRQ